jgi:small subunit ribosomal protein S13
MARIAGVNVPDNAHIVIGLQHIYGIGPSRAKLICEISQVNPQTKVRELAPEVMETVRNEVTKYTVEGDLRREVSMSIKRLVDLKCYRGHLMLKVFQYVVNVPKLMPAHAKDLENWLQARKNNNKEF